MCNLGDNATRDCSEACNSTRLCLVQLQASEPVTRGNITQIAHLAMLLIIQMFVRTYVCIQLPDEHCTTSIYICS